jgi:hypothetical protein
LVKRTHKFNGTSDRLVRAGANFRREAKRCLNGKAYIAAVVMEVSALEANLQAMCAIYPNEVKKTIVYQKKKFRRKRDRALEFTLYQLINIARELGWLPKKRVTWAGKRADIAGFTHEIREVRNFVHPARWAKERDGAMKFSKGVYGVVQEVCEVANSWLLHRVHQSLIERMEREERSRHPGKRKAFPAT